MESITTSESPVASTETPSATPAPAAASAPAVADANPPAGTDPGQPAQGQTQVGETVADTSDEFPDDAALQAMPGEERASNWARIRTRNGELRSEVARLSQLESFRPVLDSIEERGGWEQAEPMLDLATGLFTPVVDEEDNPVIDPATGLQRHTAAPFVEQLAEESPSTFNEMMWIGFDMPNPQNPNETIGHAFLRGLGLDANLLSVYKQIQSPQQARDYVMRAGGIDPAYFEGVAPEYHDALKSIMNTMPATRAAWETMTNEERGEALERERRNLQNDKYAEEQRARDQRADEESKAQAKARIEQAGEKLYQDSFNKVVGGHWNKLQQTATFFPDLEDNIPIWNDALAWAKDAIEKHPQLGADEQRLYKLYKLIPEYEANGERFAARKASVEAEKLVRKLDGKFGDFVVERTAWWSKRLGGVRATQQQQLQDAKSRIEIDSGGDVSGDRQTPSYSPPPTGQRFGMSEQRKQELAAQMRARRMGQG